MLDNLLPSFYSGKQNQRSPLWQLPLIHIVTSKHCCGISKYFLHLNLYLYICLSFSVHVYCLSDRQAEYDRSNSEEDISQEKMECHTEACVCLDEHSHFLYIELWIFGKQKYLTIIVFNILTGLIALCRLMKFKDPFQVVNSISIILFGGIKII